MTTPQEVTRLMNKRVVLTCESNVSYAGIVVSLETFRDRTGVLLELDRRSGFSVWCPTDFVKELVEVPIN
jgi:hypothetical protein